MTAADEYDPLDVFSPAELQELAKVDEEVYAQHVADNYVIVSLALSPASAARVCRAACEPSLDSLAVLTEIALMVAAMAHEGMYAKGLDPHTGKEANEDGTTDC